MPRQRTPTSEVRARINQLAKQGYTTTKIQKVLRKEGMGIRKQTMLWIVRQYYHKPAPQHPERFIPIKYRRPVPPPLPPEERLGRHLSIYGTQRGIRKRIEMWGRDGRELQQAAILAAKHAPLDRFLEVNASDLLRNPHRYLDFGGHEYGERKFAQYLDNEGGWDGGRPDFES